MFQDQLFSGLFTECNKACLSVGVFFEATDVQRHQGLVSYGQCAPNGPSWEISIGLGELIVDVPGSKIGAPVSLNTGHTPRHLVMV